MARNNVLNNDSSTFTIDNLLTVTAGGITVVAGGITVTGNSAINGGTVGIGTDAADNAINIGTSASSGRVISIGNTTGATGVQISAGSGTINGTGIAAFNGGTFAAGTDATDNNVSIGTVANAGRTVHIGNTTGTSTLLLNSGTTGITLATGTTGPIAINPGTTGAVTLGTTSTGSVSVGNSTGTTSIQFGAGSALSTYNDWTSYTPTLVGESTAGTTTYTSQVGFWMRIGNSVTVQFRIATTAATGTGIMDISLPSTTKNITNWGYSGSVTMTSGTTVWPTGTTSIALVAAANAAFVRIQCSGSAVALGNKPMANTAVIVTGSITYQV